MRAQWIHEGTLLVFDPEVGTVSARSEYEACREIASRKAAKRQQEQSRRQV